MNSVPFTPFESMKQKTATTLIEQNINETLQSTPSPLLASTPRTQDQETPKGRKL